MPFQYLELTRRQLADKFPTTPPATSLTRTQRIQAKHNSHNAYGSSVKAALDALGADDWELVSVNTSQDHGGELLYTFKK